jgi:predicted small secreted protein
MAMFLDENALTQLPSMDKIMKTFKKLAVLSAVLMAISACSTVEGLGKDLKKGGQAIQNAAKDAAS